MEPLSDFEITLAFKKIETRKQTGLLFLKKSKKKSFSKQTLQDSVVEDQELEDEPQVKKDFYSAFVGLAQNLRFQLKAKVPKQGDQSLISGNKLETTIITQQIKNALEQNQMDS